MFNKIRPLIFKLDPEFAHSLAIKALKTNLFLKQKFRGLIFEIYLIWKRD